MSNSKKFSILIALIIFSSALLNINAVTLSDKVGDLEEDYEETYANQVCSGSDNIVKAGCSVIAGQVIRGVPAMIFGASFDRMKRCVTKLESFSGTSVTVNVNDPCVQFGLYNPTLDSSKFVFENGPKVSDASVLAVTNNLYNFNKILVEKSFDNSYFASKSVENIPVARSAFAQSTGEMDGVGAFLRDTSYSIWVTTRNIAYGLIGLLSIVLGLTLMSSNSIFDNNAKWRLSLEQAIPRVIISIILIQFSYILGETLLYIANEGNFYPLIAYTFSYPLDGLGSIVYRNSSSNPILLIGAALALMVKVGVLSTFIALPILIFGIWYIYRLILLWWHNLQVIIGIAIFTFASPLIIALSLLPGEAGALQNKRYFSTLVSLVSRTFLLQLVGAGPQIILIFFVAYFFKSNTALDIINPLSGWGSLILLLLFPLIAGVIILQFADRVEGISNQFAKNVTGADPIGAQQQGK